MPESKAHKRAKAKAAGKTGKQEVPLRGGKKLDAARKGHCDRSRAERQRESCGSSAQDQRQTEEGHASPFEGHGEGSGGNAERWNRRHGQEHVRQQGFASP